MQIKSKKYNLRLLSFIAFTILFFNSTYSKVSPLTENPWQEVVISVNDIKRTAEFFIKIGDYQIINEGSISISAIKSYGLKAGMSGEELVLKAKSDDSPYIRLIDFDVENKQPMRPGSHAWDTGCYFSLMIRMKGLDEIYNDLIQMGWWTETPIASLKFGESKLKVVIFKGPDGIQIQGYERLAPPLPENYPEFINISHPFNIMQTINNREKSRQFFVDLLGFDTFFYGKPYVDQEEGITPLGLPLSLTTESRYRTAIFYPIPGEFGRVEMIEFMDLRGLDFSNRCNAPNLGLLSIKYPVEDIFETKQLLESRKNNISIEIKTLQLQPYGNIKMISLESPDGAIIEFFQKIK